MKVTDQYLEILHKYWGYPDFRGIQKEIIESIISENLSNMDDETMSNLVNVYIYRLRNKIDKPYEKKLIHTMRGLGFKISDE